MENLTVEICELLIRSPQSDFMLQFAIFYLAIDKQTKKIAGWLLMIKLKWKKAKFLQFQVNSII